MTMNDTLTNRGRLVASSAQCLETRINTGFFGISAIMSNRADFSKCILFDTCQSGKMIISAQFDIFGSMTHPDALLHPPTLNVVIFQSH